MNRLKLHLDMFKDMYLQDCLYLKEHIPQLQEADNALVQMLFTTWCDETWCVSWMKPNMDTVDEFSAWLLVELKDEFSN